MDDLLNVVWRARKESEIQKILVHWIRDVHPHESKENKDTLTVLIIPWAKEIFRLAKKQFTLLYIKSIIEGLYSPPFHVMEKLGRGVYTMRILDNEVIELSHHLRQSWDGLSTDQFAEVDAVYVSDSNSQIPGFNDWVGNLCADLCDRGKTIITDFYSARCKMNSNPNSKPKPHTQTTTNSPPSPRKFRLGNLFSRKKSREDASATTSHEVDSEENESEYVPYLSGRFASEGYYPFTWTIHADASENLGVIVDPTDANVIMKSVREVSFGDDETETETETETDFETESSDTTNSPPTHYFAGAVQNTRTVNPSRMFSARPRVQQKVPSDEKIMNDDNRNVLSHQRMIWQPTLSPSQSGSNSNSLGRRKKSASPSMQTRTCHYTSRDDLLTRKVIIPTGLKWGDGVPFVAIRTNKPGLVITLNGKFDENAGTNGGLISSGAHRLLLNCIRLRKRDLTPSLSKSRALGHHLSMMSVNSQRSISFSDVDREEKEVVREKLKYIEEDALLRSFGTEEADDERNLDDEYEFGIDDGDDDDYSDRALSPTPPGMPSSNFPTGGRRMAHQFNDEDSDDILQGLDDFEFDDDDQFGMAPGGGPPGVSRGFRPPALFRLPAI